MKKYPKMKPSGVEWIGDVPEGWEVKKLKYLASVRPSNIDKKTVEGEVEAFLCNYVDVYKNDQITKGIDFMKATASAAQFEQFRLKKGDVLATKDSEDPADIAVPALVVEDFENVVCGYHLTQITPNATKLNGAFLFWALKSKPFSGYFEIEAKGVTRYALSIAAFERALIFHPPLHEQTAIAAYLDRKTAQIDQSIAEKEGLIELFREERQAIINHAVTKGIRPGVKMKPSGVEWIGDVPEGWAVKRVKHVCNLQGRIGFKGYSKTDLVNEGEGALTLGAKHINKKNELDLSSPEFLSWEKYYESPEIMVQQGHVIVTQRGSLGKVVVIDKEIGAATINPSMILLKDLSINQHFFYYSFNGHFFTSWIEMVNNATAVPMISQEMLANLPIVCPDLAEQKEIVRYLNDKTAQIDTAISGIRQEIALLQEYRQALIFEAVTGKIDVKGDNAV